MNEVTLDRKDFRTPDCPWTEVNCFEDYLLDGLGIPREQLADIDSVTLYVERFDTTT